MYVAVLAENSNGSEIRMCEIDYDLMSDKSLSI